MDLLGFFFSTWIILSHFGQFSQAQGRFKVTPVIYIKELQSDGDVPNQEENVLANTEEKRLELCRGGLIQIKNENKRFWSLREKDVDLKGVSMGKMKVYVLKYADSDYQVNAATAYKCSTEPEIYIRTDIRKTYDNQPIFDVIIYKEKLSEYVVKRFLYKLMRVSNIIQVNPIDMLSMSKIIMGIPVRIPSFDTDKLSDEQRLQICTKGMQTSSKLNVELLRDTKTSENKFYKVTTFHKKAKDEQIIRAFECPTQPKIYISLHDGYVMGVLMKTIDGHRAPIDVRELAAISDGKTKSLYQQIKKRISDAGPKKDSTKTDQLIGSSMQNTMCIKTYEEINSDRSPGGSYNYVLHKSAIETYDELKKTNLNLCKRSYIFEDSQIIPGEEIIIINGPESVNVVVSEGGKNVTEDVYVCLIRNRYRRSEIEEYFFSEEYNVNTSKISSGYLAGRFVFKRVSNSDSFVEPIITMTQQFSERSETSNVELLYLERRKKQDLANTDSDDLLCKLDNLERSKMCTLVFHSMKTPLYEHGCARNPITFITDDGKKEANGYQYYEWMLPCHESSKDDTFIKIYYLSQAYNKSNTSSTNDVFAFSRAFKSTKIILENRYTDPRIGDLLKKK